MSELDKFKAEADERLYLIYDPDGPMWCNDPAPSPGMDADGAVEYVRADVVEQQLATEREALEACIGKAQSDAVRAAFDGIASAAKDSGDEWISTTSLRLMGSCRVPCD
ncbi:hypothetical protein P3W43_01260 [Salinicola salarius]|uniref:hypothetical protein n=1 Tax=Salinicola salarius TaxID=430457 RepID=UPI0023E38801|nr:hypothetical protein [Salinicola salarius]MDF3917477.1 hypothetical protein [Salinicola salarius]